MARAETRCRGFSLIEVLVGMTILVFVFSVAATFFKTAEYTALKARIDGRVAALVRFRSEKLLYMPYSALADLASRGGAVETGYLYQPANGAGYGGVFPYIVTTSLALSGAGTANDQVSISTTIQWEEPSPDFSRGENISKDINLGTHVRRRF